MELNPKPIFSIELYPPRTTPDESKLDEVHDQLASLEPDFFSVTYGAGGSTKQGTKNIILKYQQLGSNMVPHLSLGGTDRDDIRILLTAYKAAGINHLVALRGDLPPNTTTPVQHQYASELVEFIRLETGNHFHIDVACYPEPHPDSTSYKSDIAYFKKKIDAGANSAITQYFYNADAYFYFVDYCSKAGISVPIVPGIMPINNYTNLKRFSAKCGAEIPHWLQKRLEGFEGDVEGLKEFGIEVVTTLCERLLAGGAPGLHFYSMNLAKSVNQIWKNLALSDRS